MKLEAFLVIKLSVLRWVLDLVREEIHFLECGQKLLLLFHLIFAHDLANRNLERSQTTDMSDVHVQETLQGEALADVCCSQVVIFKHILH